ncbi:hypothetical protein [Anaerocolumna xylanovorans]|uniref:Uncharacterized protein n=1 Tax=Anaerocolumna xylanovorans DSM 12503 TaxID=1121345 RepID=A0A1M7Y860_9FIRM|nr:hypothetical protein [Anaerocolumna xylanovorans]SHO48708.1 hypothetical protein SAMN02745217_01987 [Anaerocolumna xylanovorans DSM 12503]
MNIISYKYGFRDIRNYEYSMRNEVIKLYSKSKDKGFVNYIDVVGKEHDDIFMKTISINDKNIIERYSLKLCLEINHQKEEIRIRDNKIVFGVEVNGTDKDMEQDYMMRAGFLPKDVQRDKYGLHWNHYSLDYKDFGSKFENVRLYTVKKDLRTEAEEVKDISFDEATLLFEEC